MQRMIIVAALLGVMALTACNTVRGVGEDVRSVGQTVEQAAH
jgi:predicted small secreted protein